MKTKKLNQWECGITHHRGGSDPCELCGKKMPTPTPQGQHTPTPWTTENLNPFILGPDEKAVCQMTWGKRPMAEEKANAAFIVRAVNAHEELLEALKTVKQAFDDFHTGKTESLNSSWLSAKIFTAISRAEGGK